MKSRSPGVCVAVAAFVLTACGRDPADPLEKAIDLGPAGHTLETCALGAGWEAMVRPGVSGEVRVEDGVVRLLASGGVGEHVVEPEKPASEYFASTVFSVMMQLVRRQPIVGDFHLAAEVREWSINNPSGAAAAVTVASAMASPLLDFNVISLDPETERLQVQLQMSGEISGSAASGWWPSVYSLDFARNATELSIEFVYDLPPPPYGLTAETWQEMNGLPVSASRDLGELAGAAMYPVLSVGTGESGAATSAAFAEPTAPNGASSLLAELIAAAPAPCVFSDGEVVP